MLPVQELLANLSLISKELVIPLDTQRFFYVDPEGTKNFLDQVLEIEETDMKFFNVKQSKPYSNSLDKATIVNNSNATVTQQETFTKTTTDSYTFTNSRGLNKGAAINATIGTAFLGGVGTTLNLSFNVTNTASTAKSVATSRSQQQTITVPANTSLVATWVIKNVDIDAEYKMLLKTGAKPSLKHGLIPGRLVTSDQPVAPVYKYTDIKGERFMYLPSADTQIEDFFLADLNPIFYVPAPVSQSSQAVQAGGTHRGHLKNLLWKGTHSDRALVPIYPTGSSQQDTSASMELQQSFQVNAQHSVGSVSLWRFRKLNTNEPQFRLIPSNTPESLQGWVNEGSVGFVYLNIPGMRDADTTKWGHPHALNEIQLDKDNKDAILMAAKKKMKCAKCWKKIDPSQSYFKCEQCKTPFVECMECYQTSDLSAQKLIDEAATKLQESFANMGEKIKHFSIIGKMHCTQGTHTFIDISPMSDSDKDQAHQHVQPPVKEVKEVTDEETEKEKSRKSKRFVEEFKYKKAYIEEEEDKKKATHKKTEKVIEPVSLPLPPPPPPLPPSSSRVTFQEPLPPPPPPLPSNYPCSAPSALGNPYFTSPMQNFINNPSSVQPYFVPVPAPPPPPAPIIHAGPLPSTTRTIETPYPLSSSSIPPPPPPPMPSSDMKNHPPHPPPSHLPHHMQPTLPSYRRPSVDEMYSIPMSNYSAANNPHYASPVWNGPNYAAASSAAAESTYNQQGTYNSPQPFGQQPSYDTSLPPGYSYDSTAYPAYDAPPKNYDYDSGVNQQQANYNPSYTQSYQSAYATQTTAQSGGGIGGRARNFFGRRT